MVFRCRNRHLRRNAEATLRPAQHQAAGKHVVDGLLFLGEAGDDISDAEGNNSRDYLREVAPRCAPERDSSSAQISHRQPQNFLAGGRLPFGALEQRVIEPSTYDCDQEEDANKACEDRWKTHRKWIASAGESGDGRT